MLHHETDDPLSLKEIKVRIPVSFHLKLHAFKVLKGKPISDTIVEALDAYFKAAEQRKAAAQAEHGHGFPPPRADLLPNAPAASPDGPAPPAPGTGPDRAPPLP